MAESEETAAGAVDSEKTTSVKPKARSLSETDKHYQQHVSFSDQRYEGRIKEEDEEAETSGFKTLISLSGRRKYTLILITLAQFLAGVAFSLMGPFFPAEAAKKGMDIALVGLVYGIFELMIFLTAPIYGNYLVQLGPRFVFIAGISVGGSCNILFGLLQYCPGGTPFIVMTFLVRVVESLGFSGFTTSSFAIVSSEFQDHIGFTYGILETGTGLGFMLGPTIGGALFELGGFGVPFYVAGVLVLLNAVAVYKFLPQVENVPSGRTMSIFSLLRNPMIVIPGLSVLSGVVGITAFDTLFAKHLQPLNVSVALIGVIYGAVAFVYSVMSSIWGYISDSKSIQAPLLIVGHFLFGLGFFLIGPSPLLPFLHYSLPTILVGLTFIGFSLGSLLIPGLKCMLIGATEMGLENNTDTYAMVSGLFNSLFTLGGFIGPTGVGYVVQKFDYPVGYTVVGCLNIFMMLVSVLHFTRRRIMRKRRSGYSSIGDTEADHLASISSTHEGSRPLDSGSIRIQSARRLSLPASFGLP